MIKTRRRQLHFFFTSVELSALIKEFEKSYDLSYYPVGYKASPEASIIKEINFDNIESGNWNHSPSYLIAQRNSKINVRTIILNKGGILYSFDQKENPDTIFFKPSGVFAEGILIAGTLSTISSSHISINLFDSLSNKIKRQSHKIGSFHVGLDAREKLLKGWRLTTDIASSKEYDLAF